MDSGRNPPRSPGPAGVPMVWRGGAATGRPGFQKGRDISEFVPNRLAVDPLRQRMAALASIKAIHGNSLGGRTCWLSDEYSDRPEYVRDSDSWSAIHSATPGFPRPRAATRSCPAWSAFRKAAWYCWISRNGLFRHPGPMPRNCQAAGERTPTTSCVRPHREDRSGPTARRSHGLFRGSPLLALHTKP